MTSDPLRMSALQRARKPPPMKSKPTKKGELPTDIKPVIKLENSDPLPPSYLSEVSVTPGMTSKQYWRKVATKVEDKIKCESSPKIPEIDCSYVLPNYLKKRINKIIHYEFSGSDDLVYIRDQLSDKDKTGKAFSKVSSGSEENAGKKVIELRKREVEKSFHESEFSDIERLENDFYPMDLKIDQPLGFTDQYEDQKNWMSTFLCDHDRVVWKTKACHKRAKYLDADGQAEELMDRSAERFIDWLKSVGSGRTHMTPQNVKDLFSIKGENMLLASIKSDPKEVNAVAKAVAQKWNRPEIAIETMYEDHVKYRVKQVQKKKLLSAFGRTIPQKERPWYKLPTDVPIKSVYPEELLSRERIFRGIRHLRSVKALINFYIEHPKFERPQYLVKSGDFKVGVDSSANQDIPLYEKLGLKY